MEVQETPLPGIGLRYDFVTAEGNRIGVVVHRDGRQELLIYAVDDPDACRDVVPLTPHEVDALVEVLGAPRIVERLSDLADVRGVTTEHLTLTPGSPYVDRTLGDTRARSLTGCSVVAVIRGHDVFASPRPDFVFHANDTVVVVGTPEGCTALTRILGIA